MATPACLVTSTPSFDPPKRTAPFLVAAGTRPDPRRIIVFDESKDPASLQFSTFVRSEDNGQPVLFHIYVDYGYTPPDSEDLNNGLPFRGLQTTITPVPAGTLSDPDRPVQAPWFPQVTGTIDAGCHTVTLIASHAFDPATECPKCLNDSSQITWQVFHCNSAKGDDCKPDFTACQELNWTRSCPDVADSAAVGECGDSP